jgi:Holliday junction DNA helicase RuvA
MIRFVHGILREVEDALVVVEANGIGYGIHVPRSVLGELPSIGEDVKLYTYFKVSQDGSMDLYGFLAPEDREMFVQLLSVSGVGPKGAQGILSVLKPDELRLAIVSGDAKSICMAPGIGKRTAERVILDLKDKMNASEVYQELLTHGGDNAGAATDAGSLHSAAKEAIEALVALGYSNQEAVSAVKKVEITGEMTADDVLKQSLRHLAFL